MLGALRLRKNRTEAKGAAAESPVDTSTMTFTGKMANWSARRRWWVISAAVLVIAMSIALPGQLETKLYEEDGGRSSESGAAAQLLDERFANNNGQAIEQLVFNHETLDVDSPAYEATVQAVVNELRALPEVAAVVTYYDTNSDEVVADNRGVTVAQVVIAGDPDDADDKIDSILDTVGEAAASAETLGFEVTIGGQVSIMKQMDEIAESDMGRVLLVTLVLGLVILLFAFRAVVAAVIPLTLSMGAIITAGAVSTVISQFYSLFPSYTEMIMLMGLAVGIDYSLFIISRFRSERKAGRPKYEAIAVASNTTGRAVFYAGITVLLSMFGLFWTNSPIFIGLSVGAIVVVAVAIVASLTLLPALLGALGDSVNRLRIPFIGRESNEAGKGGVWGAITDKVLARPAIMAAITVTALIAVALPVATINLSMNSGADSISDAVAGKRAIELLEEHFTSGLTSPAFVVVDAAGVNSDEVQASVATLIETFEQDDSFFGPYETRINEAGDLLYVRLALAGNVDDEMSVNAVKHLREDVVPAAFDGSEANAYVTGQTAGNMDFNDHMMRTSPYVFGFVLGLAFLLLMVMFRSIVIPLKAILLNLLSVGAAYGVLVAVFQWGWGIGLLGAEATGVIESWLPMFLFGILFGLSMDYHMLVLNRIKEAFDSGMSTEQAVSHGIKITAGQITGAAAIMVGVFGAFALMDNIAMKQFGVGLAVAVLLDATIIRSILLPASMKLLGDKNWYLPKWLEWLPKVSAEGEEQATAQEPAIAIPATTHPKTAPGMAD